MKIDRLFSIVNILINKKSITAKELAGKYNVSVRTIYRDIDILSANGVPIYCTQGKGGGISILEGYEVDKALLSDNEQKQVLVALESINATGAIDVNESLIKLKNIFKKSSEEWIQINFEPWQQNKNDKIIFESLKEAIINKKEIIFSYFSNKGEKTIRQVQPYKLKFKTNQRYLYGFCKIRKAMRFFKLTRIEELNITNIIFKRDEDICNIEIIEQDDDLKVRVKLKIDSSVAFRVYDEFRNGIVSSEGNKILVITMLPKKDWILGYLLGYGDKLEVIEPLELRNKLKEELNKIIKKY